MILNLLILSVLSSHATEGPVKKQPASEACAERLVDGPLEVTADLKDFLIYHLRKSEPIGFERAVEFLSIYAATLRPDLEENDGAEARAPRERPVLFAVMPDESPLVFERQGTWFREIGHEQAADSSLWIGKARVLSYKRRRWFWSYLSFSPFLAKFTKFHADTLGKLASEKGWSALDLKRLRVIPFVWEAAPAWMITSPEIGDPEIFFFTDDVDRFWTVDIMMDHLRRANGFIRVGDQLMYPPRTSVAGGEIDDEDDKILKNAPVAEWVARAKTDLTKSLIRDFPQHIDRLIANHHLSLAEVNEGRLTIEPMKDEKSPGREFLALSIHRGSYEHMCAIIDVWSTPERLRLDFLRPRVLTAKGQDAVRAWLDDGGWHFTRLTKTNSMNEFLESLKLPDFFG